MKLNTVTEQNKYKAEKEQRIYRRNIKNMQKSFSERTEQLNQQRENEVGEVKDSAQKNKVQSNRAYRVQLEGLSREFSNKLRDIKLRNNDEKEAMIEDFKEERKIAKEEKRREIELLKKSFQDLIELKDMEIVELMEKNELVLEKTRELNKERLADLRYEYEEKIEDINHKHEAKLKDLGG